MRDAHELEVTLDNRSGMEINPDRVEMVAEAVLRKLGFDNGELGLTFVDSDEMAQMNLEYLGREGPTDVLSFPIDAGETAPLQEGSPGAPVLLGDVVICPQVATEQAAAEASTFKKEICLLVIHGILHVAGHDHEADTGEMDEIQDRLFGEICGEG